MPIIPSLRDFIDIVSHPLGILLEGASKGAVTFTALRYHNEINRYSNELRLGTWYGASSVAISRYRNDNSKTRLGGTTLTNGTITARNPLYVRANESEVLYNVADALPFGNIIEPIARAKTKRELSRLARALVPDDTTRARILKMPDFVVMTMLSERVAAEWCRKHGHDLLVLGNGPRKPRELFDFMGLFIPIS